MARLFLVRQRWRLRGSESTLMKLRIPPMIQTMVCAQASLPLGGLSALRLPAAALARAESVGRIFAAVL